MPLSFTWQRAIIMAINSLERDMTLRSCTTERLYGRGCDFARRYLVLPQRNSAGDRQDAGRREAITLIEPPTRY